MIGFCSGFCLEVSKNMDYGAAVAQKGYDVKTCADRFLVYSSAFRTLKVFSVSSVTGTAPSNNSADFTANSGTDVITSAAHGLVNGDQVNFLSDGTLPGGLEAFEYNYPWTGEVYYVINKTTNTFQVSLTPGGSAINITSAGSGIHTWYNDTIKITVTHSLGYYAPAIWVYNGSTTLGVASSYLNSDAAYLPLLTKQYTDKTEVYLGPMIDGGSTNPGDTVYFTVYQFLDTFDAYTASVIASGTTLGASSNDYGFRISKPGFDVKTCANVDCIISSSFFTNIVHKKGTATGTVDPIQITHSLGYIPSFLAFLKPVGKSFLGSTNNLISVTTTTLDSYPDPDDVLYYVIFKAKSI